ncbi:MAG: histidine triad nucleotide-binding protein [Thermoanaerobaculia bacterium]
MDKDCLFCRIVAGEIPTRLLFEDDELIAFADIAPQAPVHLLIVPKRHLPHLFATGAADSALLGRMVATATDLARGAGLEPEGFRLVLNCLAGAGQSVFHLHLHLLGGRTLAWPPG